MMASVQTQLPIVLGQVSTFKVIKTLEVDPGLDNKTSI